LHAAGDGFALEGFGRESPLALRGDGLGALGDDGDVSGVAALGGGALDGG